MGADGTGPRSADPAHRNGARGLAELGSLGPAGFVVTTVNAGDRKGLLSGSATR